MPTLSSLSDPSIYQNIKQTDAVTQIRDLTDLGRTNLAYQKERELYKPSVEKAKAESQTAVTGAEKAKAGLQKDYFGIAADEAGSLVNDPRLEKIDPTNPKSVQAAGDAFAIATDRMIKQGVPPHLAHSFTAPYFQMLNDPNQSGNVRQNLLNSIQARIGAQGQQQLQTPSYTSNQSGEIVGLKSGTNEIISPRQNVGAPVAPAVGGAPVAAPQRNLNPTRADVGFAAVPAEVASQDIKETLNLAKGAENRVAIFQNIKRLAPEAFTSTGGGRKELVSGIAQAIGMDVYTLEKTATDELAKSSALLTLTGGNTDMARMIAESANPNKKMTKDAIIQMSNQLIGAERMNQAKAKLLENVTDVNEYNKKLQTWNKINDFRIFQETTPEEVKKLKASMSIKDQKEMSDKIALARQLGLL
jgi:hypothetical protein